MGVLLCLPSKEMDSVNRVQILDEAVSISHYSRKKLNLIILPSSMGKS